ncbi:unnamed protein product [Pelagomonas calceolata]|uniref:Calmodulin-lysine N-methyltransferase n=1 Tax=Pelagomonas calceolata TaxID=35677 RepID=A0A8J2T193_9STRA|nr:unnamed protein product [Pelagomonas calceolata]
MEVTLAWPTAPGGAATRLTEDDFDWKAADRATLTKPLALVATDADCTLAIAGAHVVSTALVSNARSVEVSGGSTPATTTYKGTVRGDQQKQPHRFRAELKALDAPFVTLKLLSRKGDARTLSIDSLEIVVDAARTPEAAPPPPPARAAATAASASSSSHQKTLLAGAALLDAAERRLTAHVDAACARVQRHLGAKLDAQGAALARLEAAVARLGTRPAAARSEAAVAAPRAAVIPRAGEDDAVGAALKKTTVRCGDHAMMLFLRAADATLAPPANGADADGTGLELWGGGRYLANFLTIRPGVVRGCRVLELGAGAGLPGLVAARCGAAEVLLTDGDARAVRLLEKNIAANPSSECPVEAAALAYGAAPPPPSESNLPTVVLAADALYVSKHCAPFGDTLNAALQTPKDVCYLAHEPRRAWSMKDGSPVQDATDDVLDAFLDLCCDLDVSEVGKTGNVQLYRIARPCM